MSWNLHQHLGLNIAVREDTMYRIKGLPSHFHRNCYLTILLLCMLSIPLCIQAVFTEMPANLTGINRGSVAWGDYDNDGDMDILLTGFDVEDIPISKVYHNDGNSTFSDINAGLMGVAWSSVTWGDYDNDGDLDILLTGSSSSSGFISKVYRNNGNSTFTDINAGLMGVAQSSVAWGDYDNDGDLDILMSGNSNSGSILKVYRNNGNSTFTDINAGLMGVALSSVAWGDYDNDGDLDILVTGDTGNGPISKIYRNDGNYTFTDIAAGLTAVVAGSANWGDYNNDGYLDILLTGCLDGNLISLVYRNNGNNTFTDISAGLTGVYYSTSIWGDYNNDGFMDILLAGNGLNGRISKVYRNNGNSTFTDISAGLTGVGFSFAAWGDYDNDGDLDILITGLDSNGTYSKVYRNDTSINNQSPSTPENLEVQASRGSLTFTWDAASDDHTPVSALNYNIRIGTSANPNLIISPMALANGNRSTPSRGNVGSQLSYTVKNLPPNESIIVSIQSVDQAYRGSIFCAPISVQTPSIVVPESVMNIYPTLAEVVNLNESITLRWTWAESATGDLAEGYLLYVGTGTSDNNILDGFDVGNVNSYTLGSNQLYSDNYNWRVVPYNSAGSAENCPVWNFSINCAEFLDIPLNLPSGCSGSIEWGDYDNDCDLDFIITGGGYTKICRNNGNATFTIIDANLIDLWDGDVSWGDYDNDGDLDILLAGRVSTFEYMAKIYRNDGNDVFTDIQTSIQSASGTTSWADYDNDGDLDILITGWTGNNPMSTVYRNDGNNTFTEAILGLTGLGMGGNSAWGDCDNDGDLDLLLVGNNISKLYINNGIGGFTENAVNLDLIVNGASVDWGDYDNDGDLDILLSGPIGSINDNHPATKIYRNEGNYEFTEISSGILGLGNYGVAKWVDLNNDGKLDIIQTGIADSGEHLTKIYINEANGVFTELQVSMPGLRFSDIATGDADNDGDADILLSGINAANERITKLYCHYLTGTANHAPSAPTFSYNFSGGLSLTADNSNDDTTPEVALNYNFQVGTSQGGSEIVSPMSNENGKRKLSAYGNAFSGKYELQITPNTALFVAAQTLDNSFVGSPFSNRLQITTPPLQITYPNGGESLVSGTTSYVRWANNSVSNLIIKLSPNNGVNWIDITAQPVSSAPGLYYYTIPSINSTQCKMKILWAKDSNYYDLSNAVFAIRNTTNQPLMNITYPIQGIYTAPGKSMTIAWTAQNVTNVSLDYTVDNGLHWSVITENIQANLSSYIWTVPDSLSNQARIRIRKAEASTYYDISDLFTVCRISLISPNGNEVIQMDFSFQSTYDITWTSVYVNNVSLYYCLGATDNWQFIATSSGSSGQYRWTLPAGESDLVRVKIAHSTTPEIQDISNNYFRLQAPVRFTNVNGGGFLNNYTTPTLRWRIQGSSLPISVYIEFSTNQNSWTRLNIAAIPLADMQLNCWLDVGTASQIWFRMLQSDNNRIIAQSTNPITITSKYIAIISPNGGDCWTVNSNQIIQWDSDGCSNVNIDYTLDDGLTWNLIATNILSTQFSCSWLVPSTPSTQCRIRISDVAFAYMYLESDQNFTIAPIVILSQPKPPDNVTITMVDNDAVLSWSAVTETINNTPIVPDGYLIFFNNSGNITNDFYYLGMSENLIFTNENVGLQYQTVFYRVVAYKDFARVGASQILGRLSRKMTETEVMNLLKNDE